MSGITGVLLLFYCLYGSSSAKANEEADTDSSMIERIEISSSRTQPEDANHSEISSVSISLQQPTHAAEIISQFPGALLSRGNNQESLLAIRSPILTGAGGCGAFVIAEDGIPTRPTGFCNLNQLFELNLLQAALVSIDRGPNSALLGAGAVHGAINVISSDGFTLPSAQINTLSGPNRYRRINTTFSTQQTTQASWLQAQYNEDDGLQQSAGYRQHKVQVGYQWQGNDWQNKTLFSLTDLDQKSAGFIQGQDSYRDPELRRSNPNPDGYRQARSWRFYSRWQYSKKDSKWSLTPYLRQSWMDFSQHYLPWDANEVNHHQSHGLQIDWQRAITDPLRFRIGTDAEWMQMGLAEFQHSPFSPTIPAGWHYQFQVAGRSLSPWMDIDWQVTDQWAIQSSARYHHQRYDYRNQLADGSACEDTLVTCRFYRPSDQQRQFANWSGKIQTSYRLNPHWRFDLTWSNGFRPPQVTELFRLQGGQQYASLDAESMQNWELGISAIFDQSEGKISLFTMHKSNVIFQDSQRFNIDGAKTQHSGIEWQWSVNLNDDWQLAYQGTIARHTYRNQPDNQTAVIQGNDIDTAPRYLGQLSATWQLTDKLKWQLRWQQQGRYYLDPSNSAEYPGHQLWHLSGNWQLSNSWEVNFQWRNLFDRDYAERADFAFGRYRYFVGTPSSWLIGVQFRPD